MVVDNTVEYVQESIYTCYLCQCEYFKHQLTLQNLHKVAQRKLIIERLKRFLLPDINTRSHLLFIYFFPEKYCLSSVLCKLFRFAAHQLLSYFLWHNFGKFFQQMFRRFFFLDMTFFTWHHCAATHSLDN